MRLYGVDIKINAASFIRGSVPLIGPAFLYQPYLGSRFCRKLTFEMVQKHRGRPPKWPFKSIKHIAECRILVKPKFRMALEPTPSLALKMIG